MSNRKLAIYVAGMATLDAFLLALVVALWGAL